jgi:uncharacterized protein (TIGR00266 family)
VEIQLLHQPDSAIAKVTLEADEEIVAEAGAMIAMSPHISANTTLRQGKGGGLLGGLKRLLGGESLFLSVFRPFGQPGEIYLAPDFMGDLMVYEMQGEELIVQSTAYVASASTVDVDLGFPGFKRAILSGESLFWLTISGQGPVLLSSFGAIYSVPVNGEYIVDTGHIVAFERSLNFDIGKPPGSTWLSTFLGGEGFVCRFKGRGTVYCQTHNPGAFGRLVGSQLPPR